MVETCLKNRKRKNMNSCICGNSKNSKKSKKSEKSEKNEIFVSPDKKSSIRESKSQFLIRNIG